MQPVTNLGFHLTKLDLSIAEYLTAARQGGLSATTVRQYTWQLERLARWLAERDVFDPAGLSRSLLREWGASLWEGWQAPTVKQAISAARAWLAWLYDEEHAIGEDLRDCLKLPPVKKRIQRTLEAAEIAMLLAGCDQTAAGRRNAAMVSLLVDSGLRAAEVCRLRWDDLDLLHLRLKVIVKGGNQEPGHYGPETVTLLEEWRAIRTAGPKVEAVFVAIGGIHPGQPLTPSGLGRILSNLGKRTGVAGVSPHSFRRAFACLLIEQGAPTRLVQEFGRWEDEKMVRQYTAALNAGRLYQEYSPTAFLKRLAGH